jgi:hypothetical protein
MMRSRRSICIGILHETQTAMLHLIIAHPPPLRTWYFYRGARFQRKDRVKTSVVVTGRDREMLLIFCYNGKNSFNWRFPWPQHNLIIRGFSPI